MGPRDWILSEIMSPRFGAAVALPATVLLRIVWLVTEIVISTILYVCVRKRQTVTLE